MHLFLKLAAKVTISQRKTKENRLKVAKNKYFLYICSLLIIYSIQINGQSYVKRGTCGEGGTIII